MSGEMVSRLTKADAEAASKAIEHASLSVVWDMNHSDIQKRIHESKINHVDFKLALAFAAGIAIGKREERRKHKAG